MTTRRVFTAGQIALSFAALYCILWVGWALIWLVQETAALRLTGLVFAQRLADLLSVGLGGFYCVVGALVVLAGARTAGVLALGGYLIAQGYATGYLHSLYWIFDWTGWQIEVSRVSINFFAYGAALRATQLFPRALTAEQLIPLQSKGRFSSYIWKFVALFLNPVRVWLLAAFVILAVPATGLEPIFHLGQLTIIVLVVLQLTGSYKTGGPTVQKQIYWLLTGAVILLLARVVSLTASTLLDWIGISVVELSSGQTLYLLAAVRTTVWAAASVGLLGCVLAAVFYVGAVNPRLVLKRTAVYSSGAGLLLFAFAVFVNFVSEEVANVLEIKAMMVESVAGAVIALLFAPLHTRLARIVERILPNPTHEDDDTAGEESSRELSIAPGHHAEEESADGAKIRQ